MNQTGTEYLLEVKNVSKSFSGVKALQEVNFCLNTNEVHVLMGANGAGKSTLVKIISGAYEKDCGEIFIQGNRVDIKTTKDAQQNGIAIIHQHFSQVPHLSVAENIFLGREFLRKGLIDYNQLYRRAFEVLSLIGIHDIDVKAKLMHLSVSQRQIVEIAKAVSFNSKILIMDEPTSALTKRETTSLFQLIHELVLKGLGIIYISHRIDELTQIGTRVTVMKDGKVVGTRNIKDSSIDDLIRMMVGKQVNLCERKNKDSFDVVSGKELFELKNVDVQKSGLKQISFKLHEGEILGLYGLMGAGKTEIAKAIFGLDKITRGKILINGKTVRISSPEDAVKQGLGFLTEDRLKTGLALSMTVGKNISLPSLKRFAKKGILDLNSERRAVQDMIKVLNIKCKNFNTGVKKLSGGNQQKAVFAKWILANSRVLILDDPTQGIDVGAIEDVHRIILDYSKKRKNGILLISSEVNEILSLCDRILIVRDGEIINEVSGTAATKEYIMSTAFAGTKDF